jgi:hypothetical protein
MSLSKWGEPVDIQVKIMNIVKLLNLDKNFLKLLPKQVYDCYNN